MAGKRMVSRSGSATRKARYTESLVVRLTPERKRAIEEFVAKNTRFGYTRTDLFESAMSAFMDEESYWDIGFRKLNRMTGAIEKSSRRIGILGETLLLFIQYYFVSWPDFAPEDKAELKRKSMAMTAKFLKALERALAKGGYMERLDEEELKDLIDASLDAQEPDPTP